MGDYQAYATRIGSAKGPEDFFGVLSGDRDAMKGQVQRLYRSTARIMHPDFNGGAAEANAIFSRLNELWEDAKSKIARGIYGDRTKNADGTQAGAVVSGTGGSAYQVLDFHLPGDFCDIHRGIVTKGKTATPFYLKIVRQPRDNDLVENEARVLAQLLATPGAALQLPRYLETLEIKDGGVRRLANAFAEVPHTHTFEAIRARYPHGIEPKHAAWMWRRLLWILHFAHTKGFVHGGVVPSHCMPLVEAGGKPTHGLILLDWSYAVSRNASARIKAIAPEYRELYAPEILGKKTPTAASDIYMAAASILWLMGGKFESGRKLMPSVIPEPIKEILRECLRSDPMTRPQDAYALHERLKDVFERAFGSPKFHVFTMPQG